MTYVAGSAKSITVDYIMVRQRGKARVRNAMVIPNEECMPKHKLLVTAMRFHATKRRHEMFELSIRVWKLKETDL